MKQSLIILLVLLTSCNNNKSDKNIFVVSEYNKLYLKDSVKYAPYDYYGPNNVIILDSIDELFYHDNWTSCGTGWKVTNPPRAIDFESYPLHKYASSKELMDKLNQTDKQIKLVILASNTDTIMNPIYFELKSRILETKDMHVIATRKMTNDEEQAILKNYITTGNKEKVYR